ncbi:MAG: hypothetical protein Q8M95_05205 [Candidatus Methanoperedens sp.]|nr:hypothetical protein [Candidatus Methanoperedens sp.]
MKSIAIVRATDILKLRSTLLEMNRAGIEFDGQPKEINPASVEKALSQPSDTNYDFCSLVPIMQGYEISCCSDPYLPPLDLSLSCRDMRSRRR